MKKIYLIIFIVLTSIRVKAQVKEKSIDIAIGYGLSFPYDNVDISGSGFYLQGEYVLTFAKWIDIRPYAGLILTQTDENEQISSEQELTSNAFLIGGKTRITAPIAWVAPYLELGIGASIGSFETVTPFTNIAKKGLLFHIPFSLGLELGPKNNFDFALTYYYHPSVEQFNGAVAFGISIPLIK